MKGFAAAIAIAVLISAWGGTALGQYSGQSYGYDPSQAYGAQQGYGSGGGYDPSAYAQQYGQYGQNYGAYGYGNQGQAGYGQGYQNNAYPGYDGAGYGYGQQQQPQVQAPAPAARQSRRAATRQASPQPAAAAPAARPYVQGPGGQTAQPDRVYQPPGALIQGEIYWDGKGGEDDPAARQQAQEQQQPQAGPAPVIRQVRNAPGATPTANVQQRPERGRKNAVKQQATPQPTASTVAPASTQKRMKWGKDESEQTETQANATTSTDRPRLQWGSREKPSAVGVEPGSFQSDSGSSSQVQAESAQGKKFRWGQN